MEQQQSSEHKSSEGAMYFFLAVLGIGAVLLLYAIFLK